MKVRVDVTVPANTPANTLILEPNIRIVVDPVLGQQALPYIVPVDKVWIIKDIEVIGSPAVDLLIIFRKNGQDFYPPVGPLSGFRVDVASAKRVTLEEFLGYLGGEMLHLRAITLTATGTSSVTVSFWLVVDVIDYSELA